MRWVKRIGGAILVAVGAWLIFQIFTGKNDRPGGQLPAGLAAGSLMLTGLMVLRGRR